MRAYPTRIQEVRGVDLEALEQLALFYRIALQQEARIGGAVYLSDPVAAHGKHVLDIPPRGCRDGDDAIRAKKSAAKTVKPRVFLDRRHLAEEEAAHVVDSDDVRLREQPGNLVKRYVDYVGRQRLHKPGKRDVFQEPALRRMVDRRLKIRRQPGYFAAL